METFDIIDKFIALMFILGAVGMIYLLMQAIYYVISCFKPEWIIWFKNWSSSLYD